MDPQSPLLTWHPNKDTGETLECSGLSSIWLEYAAAAICACAQFKRSRQNAALQSEFVIPPVRTSSFISAANALEPPPSLPSGPHLSLPLPSLSTLRKNAAVGTLNPRELTFKAVGEEKRGRQDVLKVFPSHWLPHLINIGWHLRRGSSDHPMASLNMGGAHSRGKRK